MSDLSPAEQAAVDAGLDLDVVRKVLEATEDITVGMWLRDAAVIQRRTAFNLQDDEDRVRRAIRYEFADYLEQLADQVDPCHLLSGRRYPLIYCAGCESALMMRWGTPEDVSWACGSCAKTGRPARVCGWWLGRGHPRCLEPVGHGSHDD